LGDIDQDWYDVVFSDSMNGCLLTGQAETNSLVDLFRNFLLEG
jgi:hypothetical protein